MMSAKRKSSSDYGSDVATKRPILSCVLHLKGIYHFEFISFSQVKDTPDEKLAYLDSVQDKRLAEPLDSPYCLTDICINIPNSLANADLEAIGYHHGCYQYFTKNQNRLISNPSSTAVVPLSREPRKSSSGTHLFPEECIFCDRLEKKVSRKTERCIKFAVFKDTDGTLLKPTWQEIEPRALALGLNSLHCKVHGEDLFAKGASYHQSCRRAFNLKYINHQRDMSLRSSPETEHEKRADAHTEAFTVVLDFIKDHVISGNEVIWLQYLCSLYVQELNKIGFPNPNYRGKNLKDRLCKHDIADMIDFAKVKVGEQGCILHSVIYNRSMSVMDAVAQAYKLGCTDKCEDVALFLRNTIKQAFSERSELPWPPAAEDLSCEDVLPPDLMKFIRCVISGEEDEKSERSKCLTSSIGQVLNNSYV